MNILQIYQKYIQKYIWKYIIDIIRTYFEYITNVLRIWFYGTFEYIRIYSKYIWNTLAFIISRLSRNGPLKCF